jgi:hypothetical protein
VAVGRATVNPWHTGATAEPLIVPLGRFAGADQRTHRVDTDHTVEQLSEESVAVWRLAHGPLDPILAASVPWTRTELTRYAGLAGVPDPAGVLADLLAWGLLAETPVRGDAATVFARTHRAVPLMFGLGNRPDLPHAFTIGYFDRDHVVVTGTVFDVWAACGSADSLWDACVRCVPDRPAEALTRFIEDVHRLLATDAVYLAAVAS